MATLTNPGRCVLATATAGDTNSDVVTLDRGYPYIEVTVRGDGTAGYVRFTVDTGPNDEQQATPTLTGPHGYYVGYGATRTVRDDAWGGRAGTPPASVVRVVASAAVSYVVTGLDNL